MITAEQDKVLEFIQRRFKIDCKWIDGNCYYFVIILKDRFPEGKIFYDVIWKHFLFFYQGQYYDWTGIKTPDTCLVEWDKFDEYDSTEKKRVIRDVIL